MTMTNNPECQNCSECHCDDAATAATTPVSAPSIGPIEEEIGKLEAKVKEYESGWKRALADYQNLQKETAAERSRMIQVATQHLLWQLLPVVDHFSDAMGHAPADLNKNWQQGLEHVRKELETMLELNDVTLYGNVGDVFDPMLHEAVETVDDQTKTDNTIARVVAKGYKHKDAVLRPARVIVVKNPNTDAVADASQ